MEIFGTRPDPTRSPPDRTIVPASVPRLFHAAGHRGEVHPRRAARTTRPTGWRSSWRTKARNTTRKTVERSAAMKGIMGWVRLHPYNIAQKVQIVVEHFREYVAPLLERPGQGDGGGGQPRGGGALATGHRQIHQGTRLQDRHARGLLRRGERQGIRPGRVHGEQPSAEPQPERPRHPRSVQGRRVSNPARGEQIPDRLRSAAAVRDVCGQAAGGHPGRADAFPPEPRASRQGHDLRAGFRERPGGRPRGVQDLLHHGGTFGDHRPESRLQPPRQAGRRRALRRFRGGSRRGGGTEAEREAERTGGGD